MCVPTVVEGFLVDWRCFIERFFVIRNLRQSSINRLWDVADNAWRVITFLVDIEWDVIRLVIWHVYTTGQVECDIKKIYNFLVGFDRYFKAVLAEDVAQIHIICSACRGDACVTPRLLSLYKPKL